MLRFTWDDEKNKKNIKKHKIDFNDAVKIFNGTEAIEYDQDHSEDGEDRFKAFGMLSPHGEIVVGFTEETEDLIRIFNARKVDE